MERSYKRPRMVNGQERLGAFESGRSDALELKVEKVQGHVNTS
jgi:hypothetical protein